MSHQQQSEFQLAGSYCRVAEQSTQGFQLKGGLGLNPRPPMMENMLQQSQCQSQSQREQRGQQNTHLNAKQSKYIHNSTVQIGLPPCQGCKKYKLKLQGMTNECEGSLDCLQKMKEEYLQKYQQVQHDKKTYKESFKKNAILLISFLQKKSHQICSQKLMEEIQKQIDVDLFNSGHQGRFHQYMQSKIMKFMSQEEALQKISLDVTAAVNENKQLREQFLLYGKLKDDFEVQKKQIVELQKQLASERKQEDQLRAYLRSNQENIERLNTEIKQLSQRLSQTTRNYTSLNQKLSIQIQNFKSQLAKKYDIELQAKLASSQNQRFTLERQLEKMKTQISQEKRMNAEQIVSLRQKNEGLVKELADQKKYYAQKLSECRNTSRSVEQNAVLAVNYLIGRYHRSLVNSKQTIDRQSSTIFQVIRQEASNTKQVIDQIVTLQEKLNILMFKQAKNNIELAAKDQELKNCQQQINLLNDEKSKLIADFCNLKKGYQQQFVAINQVLSYKLTQNIQQSSQHYQKMMKQQEERARLKLQTVKAELELIKQMRIIDSQRFQDQQIKHLVQVKLLKRCMQYLEQKIENNEESKELEQDAKRNQIIKEMQKFRQVEATSQNQQRLIQQLHSEVALFNKTLNFIHRQLDTKSLKEVIALIDEQHQAQYYLSLLDLINCIYYQQNQKENEVISLNLKLRALQRQNQCLSVNSGQQASELVEQNRRLMDYQKKQAVSSEKVAKLEQQVIQLKDNNRLLRQQSEKTNQTLKQKAQQLQLVTSLQAQANQNAKVFQSENFRLNDSVEQLKKEIVYNKKVYEQMATNLKNSFRNEKAQMDQNTVTKAQVEALQQKIKTLTEQNEQLRRKPKNQDNIIVEMVSLKANIVKLEQQNKRQKERSQALLQNKSNYERQLRYANEKLTKADEVSRQLTNRLKVKEEQAKTIRPSPTILKQIAKAPVNDERIKSLQLRNQILQADIQVMKKNKKTLEEKICQLRRQIGDKKPQKTVKEANKELSWSQSQEYMKGYENIIQSLRQEKNLLDEEIVALKAKVKRLQGNNRAPKSYISPGRSAIMAEKSPPKKEQMPENVQKVEMPLIPQENVPQVKRYPVFGVDCLLDEQEASRRFLLKKIQELFINKKIVQTRLVYKFTEASKAFSFATLIPKAQLQSQTFIFLFSTKTDIFGVLSYKKDAISKLTAMLFSTSTQKIVSKRPTGDSVTATPVIVEFSGQLNVGNGHLRMKSSSKTLIVKEVLGKYFEPYEKKDIYGKDYWRDEMAVDLSEFQIHKIYLK